MQTLPPLSDVDPSPARINPSLTLESFWVINMITLSLSPFLWLRTQLWVNCEWSENKSQPKVEPPAPLPGQLPVHTRPPGLFSRAGPCECFIVSRPGPSILTLLSLPRFWQNSPRLFNYQRFDPEGPALGYFPSYVSRGGQHCPDRQEPEIA